MSWMTKLSQLIQHDKHKDPSALSAIFYTEGLTEEEIIEFSSKLNYDLPEALQRFYSISDGMSLANHYAIFSLKSDEFQNLQQ